MEENQNQELTGHELEALELVSRIAASVDQSGSLIANTYRMVTGGRILEIFGKRLRYRNRDDLHKLMATAEFHPEQNIGSGNIYDVELLKKRT